MRARAPIGLYFAQAADLTPVIKARPVTDFGWPNDAADELKAAFADAVKAIPRRRLPFVVVRLSLDGAEVLDRDDLALEWRRHGLGQLVARLRAQPRDLGRVLVFLDGEGEADFYNVAVPE